jgi:hypothetical protein
LYSTLVDGRPGEDSHWGWVCLVWCGGGIAYYGEGIEADII